jgi:hypothetical protein
MDVGIRNLRIFKVKIISFIEELSFTAIFP